MDRSAVSCCSSTQSATFSDYESTLLKRERAIFSSGSCWFVLNPSSKGCFAYRVCLDRSAFPTPAETALHGPPALEFFHEAHFCMSFRPSILFCCLFSKDMHDLCIIGRLFHPLRLHSNHPSSFFSSLLLSPIHRKSDDRSSFAWDLLMEQP